PCNQFFNAKRLCLFPAVPRRDSSFLILNAFLEFIRLDLISFRPLKSVPTLASYGSALRAGFLFILALLSSFALLLTSCGNYSSKGNVSVTLTPMRGGLTV